MPKLAYLIPALTDSGLTRIPFWLSEKLKLDFDIEVFYFREKSLSDRGDVLLKIASPCSKLSFIKFSDYLNTFDIIHSHGLIPNCYVSIHRSKIKAKTITTIHGYHIEDLRYERGLLYSLLIGNLMDKTCKTFDLSVGLTQTMASFYTAKNFPRLATIYNGVDKPYIKSDGTQKKLQPSSNKIHISTISSMNPRKGIEQIIKLLQKDERFVFTAIGGNRKSIEANTQIASTLNVINRCSFMSFCSDPWRYVIDSDVFIFPSRSEGFGLALVEAALLGIPIVCSNIPTFREMFSADEVSFFDVDNIDQLYRQVLDLESLRTKAIRAQVKASSLYSIARMCESYKKLYLSIL